MRSSSGWVSGCRRKDGSPMTNTTKLIAAIFGSLLVGGLALSYLMRGTEGIAIFLVLATGIAILFAWRTH
jgi:hypothetical protein